MNKMCFLYGHRDAPETLTSSIDQALEQFYEKGFRHFIVGHYGRFDAMAKCAMLLLKKRHPDVCLSLLIPYHPAKRPVACPEGFDETFYPEGMETVPPPVAIARANRTVAQKADGAICYVRGIGNARDLLAYQQKNSQTHIVNLAEQ